MRLGINDEGFSRIAQAVQQQQQGGLQIVDKFESPLSQVNYFSDGMVAVYVDGSLYSSGGPSGSALVDMAMGVDEPGGWSLMDSNGERATQNSAPYWGAVNAVSGGTPQKPNSGEGGESVRTEQNDTDQFYIDSASDHLAEDLNEKYQQENVEFERPENVRM